MDTLTLDRYYTTNSFWTNRQRQAHSLNEISYRACFKPQLPLYFINEYTKRGDIVLDPFMGRGTTAIQSALSNRVAYGSDINPLSKMLSLPRLLPPRLKDVEKRFHKIPLNSNIADKDKDLLVFYHKHTLKQLIALKKWFIDKEKSDELTNEDVWIRMVILNRLSGHSKGFLSVKTMPPNQAVSIERQRKINKDNEQKPEPKNILEIVMKKSLSLLRSGYPPLIDKHKLACCSAYNLKYIKDNEVALIVTSPPFLDVVNYAQDNWLRCWFANINIDDVQMDNHRTIENWEKFVRKVFDELARVVKPNGYVAFEVGEVRKGKIKLENNVLRSIYNLPFDLVRIFINKQDFTKTSNCWGVGNNTEGTLTNRIVLLKKHGK